MQIDIPVLLSLVSVTVAIIMCIINATNLRRNRTHDDRQATTELTTLLVKIENINNGINEIKSDMRNMNTDLQKLRDRMIIVEQSSKSAHHRIDKLEGKE